LIGGVVGGGLSAAFGVNYSLPQATIWELAALGAIFGASVGVNLALRSRVLEDCDPEERVGHFRGMLLVALGALGITLVVGLVQGDLRPGGGAGLRHVVSASALFGVMATYAAVRLLHERRSRRLGHQDTGTNRLGNQRSAPRIEGGCDD